MKRIREVELRISKEYKQQNMRCPVHLSVGQEITSAVLSLLVQKKDYSVSTHRGHAHYLAKGGCLKSLVSELYGKSTGCSSGKGGSMHLVDTSVNFMGTSAIVGNSIPTGTGLALAAKLNQERQLAIIHLGDGATEEGVFYESLNFAAVHQIPALFLCENNFYSVYSPLEVRQPNGRCLKTIASALGLKSFFNNGKCPFSIIKIMQEAINFCREKTEPVFMEVETFRWLEHCGPNNDDDLNYRPGNQIKSWFNDDPLKKLELQLDDEQIKKYNEYCQILNDEINKAFEYAELSLPPPIDNLYKDIYSFS